MPADEGGCGPHQSDLDELPPVHFRKSLPFGHDNLLSIRYITLEELYLKSCEFSLFFNRRISRIKKTAIFIAAFSCRVGIGLLFCQQFLDQGFQ
jgi:hypothetical protein